MEDLVFVSHRIPYPPNKGDKTRSWNFLCRLAGHYAVHLATFVDDPADWQHVKVVQEICETTLIVQLKRTSSKLRSLRGLATGEPLTVPYFYHPKMKRRLDSLFEQYRPRKLYAFSSGIAAYAMEPRWAGVRRIIDLVDVDSEKWRQYADRKSGVARWVYGREARTLLAFERKASEVYDATVFVSDAEADLFRSLSPKTAPKIHAVRQGVDAQYFDPDREYENPYPADVEPIVFTGTMDYWPNVDAVTWFAAEALAELRERRRTIAFFIVGSNPTREVAALGSEPAVVVTGRVPDIRPYLQHAKLVVAPLRVARGVQTKVLEGMAMGKTVVASPMALEGIEAEPGRHLLVAETSREFARAVTEALDGKASELGSDARVLVNAHYSWDASYSKLRELLEAG